MARVPLSIHINDPAGTQVDGPEGLSLHIAEVSHDATRTLLRGELYGAGSLQPGDRVVAGGLLLEVRLVLQIDAPDDICDVAIVLEAGLPLDGCLGTTVTFRRAPPPGVLALTADGRAVPEHVNVLVGYSTSSLAMGVRFGVLVFDGLKVGLVDHHGSLLLEGTGPELAVAPVGGTRLCLTRRGGGSVDLVGPESGWATRPPAPDLIARYRALVVPDSDLEALSRWAGRSPVANAMTAVTEPPSSPAAPSTDAIRQQLVWRGVLVTMMAARGVRMA